MERSPMAVALLKRSDAELWRVYAGVDWADFAAGLGREHCFDVLPVLVAPVAPDDATHKLDVACEAAGIQLHNKWFTATRAQIGCLLMHLLPPEHAPAVHATDGCSDVSARTDTYSTAPVGNADTPVSESPPVCNHPEAPVCEGQSGCTPAETPVSESASDSNHTDVDDVLLEYCEPCTTREASKASDVRACLTGMLGKPAAAALLKRTRPSVAQDMSGQKQKVLKLGNDYLKLR